MSLPGRSNPFAEAVSKEAVSDAAPTGKSAGGMTMPAPAGPPRHPRGISLVGTRNTLKEMPLRQATLLSVALHMISPIVLFVLGILLMLLLSALLHINPWDWFKPKQVKPDLVFTIVQERNDPRPETAQFKSTANQQAGGVTDPKKALAPVEDQIAPTPKPQNSQPRPQPAKPAPKAEAPQETETPRPTPPKPKTSQPISNKPPVVTAVNKPAQQESADSSQSAETSAANQLASASAVGSTPANAQNGPGKLPGVNVQKDVDMGPYMAELKKRLDRHWKSQGIRSTKDHRVELMFYINRDGSLDVYGQLDRRAGEPKVEVKRSSGNAQYDQWAVNAVLASAPFKPLPPELEYDVVPILFTFDYNVINP